MSLPIIESYLSSPSLRLKGVLVSVLMT